MKHFLNLRVIIGIASFFAWPAAGSGEFDYDSYTHSTLQSVVKEEQDQMPIWTADEDAAEDVQIECRFAKYQVLCRYSTDIRLIPKRKIKLLMEWMAIHKLDAKYATLYKHEIRVTEGASAFWIPIQEQLCTHLNRELVNSDTILLFVIWIGKVESEFAFIATEFVKLGPPAANTPRTTATSPAKL
jgi:hypothetical protein